MDYDWKGRGGLNSTTCWNPMTGSGPFICPTQINHEQGRRPPPTHAEYSPIAGHLSLCMNWILCWAIDFPVFNLWRISITTNPWKWNGELRGDCGENQTDPILNKLIAFALWLERIYRPEDFLGTIVLKYTFQRKLFWPQWWVQLEIQSEFIVVLITNWIWQYLTSLLGWNINSGSGSIST